MLRVAVLACVLAFTAAACVTPAEPPGTGAFAPIAAAPMMQPVSTQPPAEYRLSPFDKIGVVVYQMPSLTFPDLQIDAEGKIMMPQVGAVVVSGKSVNEVRQELTSRLSECCLVNPQVVVTLREALSQQITVTGAVRTPNIYPVRGRLTLMQAISLAGGADQQTADLRTVGVQRTINGRPQLAKFDLKAISEGTAPDPEILAGDTVIVDTSDRKTAWRNAIQAVPFFGVFTLF